MTQMNPVNPLSLPRNERLARLAAELPPLLPSTINPTPQEVMAVEARIENGAQAPTTRDLPRLLPTDLIPGEQ